MYALCNEIVHVDRRFEPGAKAVVVGAVAHLLAAHLLTAARPCPLQLVWHVRDDLAAWKAHDLRACVCVIVP